MKSLQLLICSLLLATTLLQAQDSAVVRFYVNATETYYIRIDEELLPIRNYQTIELGNHDIEIFSPKHLLFKDRLNLKSTDSISFYADLPMHPDFISYSSNLETYQKTIARKQAIPAFASGLGIVLTPLFYIKTMNSHEEAVKNRFLAETGAVSQSIAQEFENRYQINRGVTITASVMAIGGAALYLFFKNQIKDLERPRFKQQNPFTMEYFELSYNYQMNAPQASLSLHF